MTRHKHLWLVSCLALLMTGVSPWARASGIGGSLELGGGAGVMDLDRPVCVGSYCVDEDDEIDIEDYGQYHVGFVFDTNIAADKLFNYRLEIGLGGMSWDLKDDFSRHGEVTVGGITLDNTFGFGVLRRDKLRLWFGPQVRLGYYAGDYEGKILYTSPVHEVFLTKREGDIELWEFAIGPVAGLNWHLGQNLSLGFLLGWRLHVAGGTIDVDATVSPQGNYVPAQEEDFVASYGEGFVNLSLLYRFDPDRFFKTARR